MSFGLRGGPDGESGDSVLEAACARAILRGGPYIKGSEVTNALLDRIWLGEGAMSVENGIKVERAAALKAKPADESSLGFGRLFTDHIPCEYGKIRAGTAAHRAVRAVSGWPACACCITARPSLKDLSVTAGGRRLAAVPRRDNFERMARSARAGMPAPDVDRSLAGLKRLLAVRGLVPRQPGTSLYIRPTLVAMDAKLGVHAAQQYLLYIILARGCVLQRRSAPNDIVEDQYVRAVKGGVGEAGQVPTMRLHPGRHRSGKVRLRAGVVAGRR